MHIRMEIIRKQNMKKEKKRPTSSRCEGRGEREREGAGEKEKAKKCIDNCTKTSC